MSPMYPVLGRGQGLLGVSLLLALSAARAKGQLSPLKLRR